jgi:hypothetical protein
MQLCNWVARVAVAAMVLGASATASGQTVTFSDLNDAVPGRFFDAATSAPDPNNPNRLIVGFNTGLDFRTWKANDFRASTASFSHTSAMDTLSFVIQAPDGYYISKITYTQRGTGYVLRTARAAGTANWVIGEYAADLGVFGSSPDLSRTMDLSATRLTRVPVSISNSLFAFSTPLLGSASVSVTGADVVVELAALAETGGE